MQVSRSRHRRRQWAPWVLFLVLAALVLGLAIGVSGPPLLRSFEQVEAEATAQKALQVYRAFEADLRQLQISNRDYAQWDDSVQFVRDHNQHYIDANLVHETLNGMHVDVVWIVDRDGREIYSGVTDRSGAPVVSPAPRAALEGLARFLPAPHAANLQPATGLVSTARGLVAVTSRQIQSTDQTVSSGATLVFARFIKASDIARIAEACQLPVHMTYLAGQSSLPAGLPKPVQAWLTATGGSSETFAVADDDRQITGYAVVRDPQSHPIALFSTAAPRTIYALGRHTAWMILATNAVALFGFGAALIWMILRLQRSFAARAAVELRYQNIAGQLREPIVLLDEHLEIIEANEAARKALHCTHQALDHFQVQDLFPELTRKMLEAVLQEPTRRSVHESRVARAEGGWSDAEVNITCLQIQGRTIVTLVAHDISHRKAAETRERESRRKLSRLARHDSLTGLPNRLYLAQKMPRVIHNVATGDTLLAVLYVDIDNFKNINDSLGHGSGDRLLQIIARRMRAAVAVHHVVARLGGDEFVIVAPLMANRAAIDALTERLLMAVRAPIALGKETVTATASVGVAVYPADGPDFKVLQKHADIALYQAKEAGRNCYRYFSADMDVRVSEHLALEQALRHAIGTPQIFMEYQPIVDLKSGQLTSLEALMRWAHPERGIISPLHFIPIAEQSGLIVELGLQALSLVGAQIRAWLDRDVPIVPVAVNVSPLQLERTDFASQVSLISSRNGIDTRWLRFEVTESAMVKEPEKLIGILATLRQMGAQILIDDFGTGYSSLSYLNRMPVDILKIDRAFVRDLKATGSATPLIHAMIDMARKLNLKTVAEGVETREQAELLREYGCDFAQGYLYSKPVAARQCRALLRELKRVRPLTETVMVRALAEAEGSDRLANPTSSGRRRRATRAP